MIRGRRSCSRCLPIRRSGCGRRCWPWIESVLVKPLEDIAFPTLGDVLLQVVVGHTAYHAGQLAVWRRAIGKDSAGVFV